MTLLFAIRFWRVGRAIAKWTAIVAGVLTILIVLLYLEEDWRGSRDWEAAKKQLLAKGESLDLSRLVPARDPHNDLSRVPIFAEIYQLPYSEDGSYARMSVRADRIDIGLGCADYRKIPDLPGYSHGSTATLVAWQHFYRSLPQTHFTTSATSPAEDVLRVLKQLDPELHEVETAIDNPEAYWPNESSPSSDFSRNVQARLKAYGCLQSAARGWYLRAEAHLENHEADQAENDFRLGLNLSRTFEKNSTIISYLMTRGFQSTSEAILLEGIKRHDWSAHQLTEMESMLAERNGLALAIKSLRISRAEELYYFDFLQARAKKWQESHALESFFNPRIPNGWWNQDRRAFCLSVQHHIEAIDPARGILNKIADPDDSKFDFASIFTPMTRREGRFSSFDEKVAEMETQRRFSRLACRLEEFHLIRKQYPERLNELPDLPPHLDQQVLTAQPLHYQRKGDGYLLYSPGWDEKDRGGVGRKQNQTDGAYDWIWPGP